MNTLRNHIENVTDRLPMYRDHEPKSKHKNLPNPKTEPSEASNSNPAATVNHHHPEDHQPIQQVDFDFMKKALLN